MNIFFLSTCPALCALFHCDKHVVKMILETTQLLWSAHHVLRGPSEAWSDLVPKTVKVYRLTHTNHPMSIWVRKDPENYTWTCRLGLELCKEYSRRFKSRTHACQVILEFLSMHTPFPEACSEIPGSGRKRKTSLQGPGPLTKKRKTTTKTQLCTSGYPMNTTPPPLCMDVEYITGHDLVQSYRNYYKKGKKDIAQWKHGKKPEWFAPLQV